MVEDAEDAAADSDGTGNASREWPVNKYAGHLMDCGGLQKLEMLQDHENSQISQHAFKILHNYVLITDEVAKAREQERKSLLEQKKQRFQKTADLVRDESAYATTSSTNVKKLKNTEPPEMGLSWEHRKEIEETLLLLSGAFKKQKKKLKSKQKRLRQKIRSMLPDGELSSLSEATRERLKLVLSSHFITIGSKLYNEVSDNNLEDALAAMGALLLDDAADAAVENQTAPVTVKPEVAAKSNDPKNKDTSSVVAKPSGKNDTPSSANTARSTGSSSKSSKKKKKGKKKEAPKQDVKVIGTCEECLGKNHAVTDNQEYIELKCSTDCHIYMHSPRCWKGLLRNCGVSGGPSSLSTSSRCLISNCEGFLVEVSLFEKGGALKQRYVEPVEEEKVDEAEIQRKEEEKRIALEKERQEQVEKELERQRRIELELEREREKQRVRLEEQRKKEAEALRKKQAVEEKERLAREAKEKEKRAREAVQRKKKQEEDERREKQVQREKERLEEKQKKQREEEARRERARAEKEHADKLRIEKANENQRLEHEFARSATISRAQQQTHVAGVQPGGGGRHGFHSTLHNNGVGHNIGQSQNQNQNQNARFTHPGAHPVSNMSNIVDDEVAPASSYADRLKPQQRGSTGLPSTTSSLPMPSSPATSSWPAPVSNSTSGFSSSGIWGTSPSLVGSTPFATPSVPPSGHSNHNKPFHSPNDPPPSNSHDFRMLENIIGSVLNGDDDMGLPSDPMPHSAQSGNSSHSGSSATQSPQWNTSGHSISHHNMSSHTLDSLSSVFAPMDNSMGPPMSSPMQGQMPIASPPPPSGLPLGSKQGPPSSSMHGLPHPRMGGYHPSQHVGPHPSSSYSQHNSMAGPHMGNMYTSPQSSYMASSPIVPPSYPSFDNRAPYSTPLHDVGGYGNLQTVFAPPSGNGTSSSEADLWGAPKPLPSSDSHPAY